MFILKQYLFIFYIISVFFSKTFCEKFGPSYNEEDYSDEENDADDYEDSFSDNFSDENNSKRSLDSPQVTSSSSFIGSNLFDSSPVAQSCFSKNDIALLTIRKDFEVQFCCCFIPIFP